MTRKLIERILKRKGETAPRITPEHVEGKIVDIYYHDVPKSHLTMCVLKLENGFETTGFSSAVSSSNPSGTGEELGRNIAYKKAVDKIYELEAYLLKQKLYEETLNELKKSKG